MVGNLGIDLTSGRFGSLTVKAFVGDISTETGSSEPHWKVRCSCGNEVTETHGNLLTGKATSCAACQEDSALYA